MSQATSTPTTSRRAIMAGATALAAGSVANLTAIVQTHAASRALDPILAAIEAHRTARQASEAMNFIDDVPDEEVSAGCDVAEAALKTFLATTPTTLAGCVAALRHINDHMIEHEETDVRMFGFGADQERDPDPQSLGQLADAFMPRIAAVLAEAVQS